MDLIWGPLNRPKFGVAKVCVCRVVRGRSAGPNSGPPGGLEFRAAGCASAQAFAFFKWINFALSEAPADRDPLIVNMDETALAYHIPAAQGTVATVARRAGGGQAVDHASLADTRGHVSYLATIASDPTVQPQLPQVILGNEHKFTLKALRSVAPARQISTCGARSLLGTTIALCANTFACWQGALATLSQHGT